MAWDIYGNRLTPGYCEVHPWIPEEYPCYQCMRRIEEDNERQRQDMLIREHYEQQQREYQEECELEIISSHSNMIDKIINKIS